jgi:DNA-binding NtrC family response regulator
MNGNVLLIANRDVCSNEVVATAVAQTGRRLQHAKTSRDAYHVLSTGLEDIDAIIIDLDPALHSLSILEAISYCKTARPVIVVAVPETLDMAAIAYRHGAAICINAPFNETELTTAINDVCVPTQPSRPASSDKGVHSFSIRNQMSQRAQTG